MKKTDTSSPPGDCTSLEKPVRFLRRPHVCELTGLKTSTLYEMMLKGQFPKPIRISKRLVVWLEDDVAVWQAARIAEART